MTEVEKIAYAKSFIDLLANGINPLNGECLSDKDVVNNVRISRCLFYVSSILQSEIEREEKKIERSKKTKISKKKRFNITIEQREQFECSPVPIPVTAVARKINYLVPDVYEKTMDGLSFRKINQWLLDTGLFVMEKSERGKYKPVPSEAGIEAGLEVRRWERHGRMAKVTYFSEEAQRLIIDNIDAIIDTPTIKDRIYIDSMSEGENWEESEDQIDEI